MTTATNHHEPIGTTVKAVRRRMGLTLAEVCDRATARGHRLSKSALSRIESGQRWLTESQAEALADVLGVRPVWVVVADAAERSG